MLPAFAELEQLAARIPGGIEEADEPRAQAALDDASTLIRAEVAPTTWTTNGALDADLPDIVVMVTLWAARRAFENPGGVEQESLGQYSVSLANSSTDVYLTAAERRQIRKAAGLSGVWAQGVTRGDLETKPVLCDSAGVEYLDVDPPGEPMPWVGP